MQLNMVVFPAPLGPIRPRMAPSETSKDTPSRATIPPNRMLTPRIESRGLAMPVSLSAAGPPSRRSCNATGLRGLARLRRSGPAAETVARHGDQHPAGAMADQAGWGLVVAAGRAGGRRGVAADRAGERLGAVAGPVGRRPVAAVAGRGGGRPVAVAADRAGRRPVAAVAGPGGRRPAVVAGRGGRRRGALAGRVDRRPVAVPGRAGKPPVGHRQSWRAGPWLGAAAWRRKHDGSGRTR